MNTKHIFKTKKNKFESISKIEPKGKENVSVISAHQEIKDVPKVIFKNEQLQFLVGQWLGISSSQEKVNITEIVKKFGFLLKLVGIDSNEICVLDQLDEHNFSFYCRFIHHNNTAKISLEWGNFLDFGPEFTIDYLNESKTYEYFAQYEEKPIIFYLQHYTIKNSENKNSCYRYLSPYSVYFELTNGEYIFCIDIKRQKNDKSDKLSDNDTFKLDHENELQRYLLGLTFPLDINKVYKKICEISTSKVEEYPSFEIKVQKKPDLNNDIEDDMKTTDKLSLSYGQLKELVVTKGNKKIAIDRDGNWSYNSPKLFISQDNKGSINYTLNSINNEKLLSEFNPYKHYCEVIQEVEQVSKLAKTMSYKK